MKPRVTFITLGVDDLERSLAFYRDGLGLATDGIVGTEFEYGAALRANLFGYAVVEIDYVRPLDRPQKGWFWQFSLRPGF